jgi:uncharacterized protein involved in propanediol utilization
MDKSIGIGDAHAHHGEVFQGVIEDESGRLHRGLISLTFEKITSKAIFHLNRGGTLTVYPQWKAKALAAASITLEYLGARLEGRLEVHSRLPPGWGLGSSTSDVVAAIRATCDTLGITLKPELIARFAVKAEVASDSLMFGNRAVVFAHREGVVIEDLSGPLPPLEILGFNTDPLGRGIDTLKFSPARYSWREIEAFRPLIGYMRKAVCLQSPRIVGKVASASARINQYYIAKPNFDQLERICDNVGGLGLQVAHSGTIAGLLFDPADPEMQEKVKDCQAYLKEIGISTTWRINTRERGLEEDGTQTGSSHCS